MKKTIDWPEVAANLAAAFPRTSLHPAVLAWVDARPVREPWAVAFSGGADSLALLLLLWAHWPERRGRLRGLHFNHKLRGRAADADENFCDDVCAALGVKSRAGAWRKAKRGASEAEARTARMVFFEKELRAARCRVLWFGHQMDDVAETLLMRLARGSGAGGLSAPRPVQLLPGGQVRLRPLLTLQKAGLAGALGAAGATWREDASNATGDFFRNRIRRDVLPAWRAAASGRDALVGAALTRELLAEDDVALEVWLDEVQPFTADGALDVSQLAGKPRALVRRALHRWMSAQPGAGEFSRQGFEALLAAVQRGRSVRHSLGAQGFAVIRRGRLVYEKRKSADKKARRFN
ncbi:MAG TPA: tRNA lysidine(34) synthetase TilS [Opitutaceae bacterium]|jgi:tRNA(Ile)-lysidine synthase|nr:tRNA lysidine(34) synthetase TilS [Opitutaceae bacterium]